MSSSREPHEYFKKRASEWNIIGFLNTCELESFRQKIECYLCSLEMIKNTETSQRREKAQALFDKYKEAGIRFTSFAKNIENGVVDDLRALLSFKSSGRAEPRPDRELARKWECERVSKQVHIHNPTYFDYGSIHGPIHGTVNGTITGGTFIAGTSESKKDREKDLDKEINNFFQSPSEQKSTNPIKKRRKSEIISNEQGIFNEADNEEDKFEPDVQDSTSICEENDSDYKFASEDDDDLDYIPSDIEGQCPQPFLLSSQLEKFRESHKKMSVAHKWVLSFGRCVEDTLFEHCERLPVESLLHSWVIDLDDREAESLFTTEEWNEIQRAVKKLPETDRTFAGSMMRFSDVNTTSDLRRVLKTTSFLNEDEPYDRLKHYDAEWAEIVMRKFLTYYEDPNEILQRQHLESWYDINVWSISKGSTSVAVATRKNRKRVCTRRKKPERRIMGYRMDGIFRMYVGDVEYGAIEVGKRFDETKLLTDGFKLAKAMHDIFVCLSKEAHFEETKVRQLQVAGMLHMGLKLQVLRMSSPKGYVTILKREKLLDVPTTVERIKDLIRVLANVWRMKKMIMECVETVKTRTHDQTDFLREIMGTDTPPITIVVPWSIDTK
ncbi:hypothetical protein RclHR1_02240024 [Rhizophagus clarus]|uniref:Uncharacterized protein n=1 Tax=Rhizophagus clarus TaxID=94130 RepID=A0A2Z6QZ26_9GLOM|nr:hypothetical protein RclHR1_02240024 [Rhizophagus clarus]